MRMSLADYDMLVKRGCVPPLEKKSPRPKGGRVDSLGKITITIPGPPAAKPRMTRRDRWFKRDATGKYWSWCDLVRSIAGNVPSAENIKAVNWVAYFEPPKSWPKHKRLECVGKPHRSKPDRDNIDKAVLDCLWQQDAGIAAGSIEKLWDHNARLVIEILI